MKYRDQKGNYYEEESSQDRLLKWMYSHTIGRFLLKGLVNPVVSKLGGVLLNTKLSTGLISPFVKKNHICMSQYEKKRYHSYNDFFVRKIRPEMRPICLEKNCFISPSDGKLSVYKISCQHFSDTSFICYCFQQTHMPRGIGLQQPCSKPVAEIEDRRNDYPHHRPEKIPLQRHRARHAARNQVHAGEGIWNKSDDIHVFLFY